MPAKSALPEAAVRCTVAIPVYNRADMVLRAVESALAQNAAALEVLVVDNCSTDGTWELLQALDDPRIRLVRNDANVGLFGNFNRCLDLASGTYLRFLCSDDVLAPNCLRDEILAMEANPSAVLLSSMARRIRPSGELLGTHADHFPAGLYPGAAAIGGVLWFRGEYGYNPLNYPSGILIRTAAARRAGPFDVSMRMAADMDFFFRTLALGDLLVLDRHGCDITIHSDQEGVALTGRTEVMEEEYLLLERFGERLGSARALRHVTDQIGGLCLRHAIGNWRRGERELGRRHIALARAHGSRLATMAAACVRIFTLRLLLRVLGIRRLPAAIRRATTDHHVAGLPDDRSTRVLDGDALMMTSAQATARTRAITDSRK